MFTIICVEILLLLINIYLVELEMYLSAVPF